VERDENYVPRTRGDYRLPPPSRAHVRDYHEIFEEAPIYTLVRMLVMQAFGWQYYLFTNALGSPMYPKGTNVTTSPSYFDDVRLTITTALLAVIGPLQTSRTKGYHRV
jgi:hypothetical protein